MTEFVKVSRLRRQLRPKGRVEAHRADPARLSRQLDHVTSCPALPAPLSLPRRTPVSMRADNGHATYLRRILAFLCKTADKFALSTGAGGNMAENKDKTIDTPERLKFDEARLNAYLAAHIDGYAGPLDVKKFAGGESNPTYLLTTPARQYVLRRKPPGRLTSNSKRCGKIMG